MKNAAKTVTDTATKTVKRLEFTEIKNPDKFARKYIVAAIFVSIAVWDVAFNLGAFKTIFFEKFFIIWVISLAILLSDIALREKRLLNKTARFSMLVPTFVAGMSAWVFWFGDTLGVFGWISFTLGSLLTILFLPYSVYIILHITREDVADFKESRPLAVSLLCIAIFIGSLGFLVGHYNKVLLTCNEFKVSGNDLPNNCLQE